MNIPVMIYPVHNPFIQSFCAVLSHTGLKPMKVVGAAIRKRLHLVFGDLKSGRPFNQITST